MIINIYSEKNTTTENILGRLFSKMDKVLIADFLGNRTLKDRMQKAKFIYPDWDNPLNTLSSIKDNLNDIDYLIINEADILFKHINSLNFLFQLIKQKKIKLIICSKNKCMSNYIDEYFELFDHEDDDLNDLNIHLLMIKIYY